MHEMKIALKLMCLSESNVCITVSTFKGMEIHEIESFVIDFRQPFCDHSTQNWLRIYSVSKRTKSISEIIFGVNESIAEEEC